MTTTIVPKSPARSHLGAICGSAAYWIRHAADHLDKSHSTDDPTFAPGEALSAALGLSPLDGIDKVYALEWGIEVGLAIAEIVRENAFADHTEAVAAIIAEYRARADELDDHMAAQEAEFGPRVDGTQRPDGSFSLIRADREPNGAFKPTLIHLQPQPNGTFVEIKP